ncbi:hypothetical protein L6164_003512 [Bauhinia variegata]|uniref:Uncharacterized protein n=1 Tax=Bauhinia variegata TaxID=167791 RepID=A0ACB9Q703_BAUVA|nr:hypothetical protein L6164_003512 [Bauhinia variegata]
MDVQIQKQLDENGEEIVRRTPPSHGKRMGKENILPVSIADLVHMAHEVESLGVLQAQKLNKPSLTWKAALLRFISSTMACSTKLRNIMLVLLFEALLGQLVAVGSPFDLQLKGTDTNIVLSFGQASFQLLPMIIWTAMFMLILVYTTILIWPLPVRVLMISVLLLAPLYYFSVLRCTLSGLQVLICGHNEVPGFLFATFASLAIAFLLGCLLMLAAFASWLYIDGEEGAMSS